MCGFKYGEKDLEEPQSCPIPYMVIGSLMQIWWVFTVVRATSSKPKIIEYITYQNLPDLCSQTAGVFVVDLLPVELVLGFHRSLEVIEEDMDKLFDHRYDILRRFSYHFNIIILGIGISQT